MLDFTKITKQIEVLKLQGGKIIVDPKSEDSIVALAKLKDEVERAWEFVIDTVQAEADKLQGFKGVETDLVKVSYRAHGARYKVVDAKALPANLKETVKVPAQVNIKPNMQKIASYVDLNGKAPKGAEINDRQPKVNIDLKEVKNG